MTFKEWLLSEKTLYHGTIIDNLDSIRHSGLVGSVGKFTSNAYDEIPEEELPEIVFAADKGHVKNALTAMTAQIGHKLNKTMHDVTDNDIRNHGLLVITKNGDEYATHRPEDDENYYGQYPPTVEPSDYYAEDLPTHGFIKGSALLRVLRRLGVFPRDWMWADYSPDLIRGELIKLAIREHPNKPKKEIINKVKSMSTEKAREMLGKYRRSD